LRNFLSDRQSAEASPVGHRLLGDVVRSLSALVCRSSSVRTFLRLITRVRERPFPELSIRSIQARPCVCWLRANSASCMLFLTFILAARHSVAESRRSHTLPELISSSDAVVLARVEEASRQPIGDGVFVFRVRLAPLETLQGTLVDDVVTIDFPIHTSTPSSPSDRILPIFVPGSTGMFLLVRRNAVYGINNIVQGYYRFSTDGSRQQVVSGDGRLVCSLNAEGVLRLSGADGVCRPVPTSTVSPLPGELVAPLGAGRESAASEPLRPGGFVDRVRTLLGRQ
jgi:hypothetical protein